MVRSSCLRAPRGRDSVCVGNHSISRLYRGAQHMARAQEKTTDCIKSDSLPKYHRIETRAQERGVANSWRRACRGRGRE